jgi:hypothetical protein
MWGSVRDVFANGFALLKETLEGSDQLTLLIFWLGEILFVVVVDIAALHTPATRTASITVPRIEDCSAT